MRNTETEMRVMSLNNMGQTNPNHNVWDSNDTWWVHYTVYPTAVTKQRVRRSLHTKSVTETRRIRDALLRRLRTQRHGTKEPVELALAA